MNTDSACPRISPAESFLRRPEKNQNFFRTNLGSMEGCSYLPHPPGPKGWGGNPLESAAWNLRIPNLPHSSRAFRMASPSMAFRLATWSNLPIATAVFILKEAAWAAPSSLKAYIACNYGLYNCLFKLSIKLQTYSFIHFSLCPPRPEVLG